MVYARVALVSRFYYFLIGGYNINVPVNILRLKSWGGRGDNEKGGDLCNHSNFPPRGGDLIFKKNLPESSNFS